MLFIITLHERVIYFDRSLWCSKNVSHNSNRVVLMRKNVGKNNAYRGEQSLVVFLTNG